MTDLLQRAAARVALRALNADSNFAHAKACLKKTFGGDVVKRIEDEVAFWKAANEDAQKSSAPDLTPEAATYWSEVVTLIERGKAIQASSDREAETILFKQCERQVERFEELVSEGEKHKFKMYDPRRSAETYDPRWSYLDHNPPLLRDDFVDTYMIPNVGNYAQTIVLATIAQPEPTAEESEKSGAATLEMFRLYRANKGLKELETLKKEEKEAERTGAKVRKVELRRLKSIMKAAKEAEKKKRSGSSQNAMKNQNEGSGEQ